MRLNNVALISGAFASIACQLIAGIDKIEEYKPIVGEAGGTENAGQAGLGGIASGAGAGGAAAGAAGASQGGTGGALGCSPNPTPTKCVEGVPQYCATDGTWQDAARCDGSTPRCDDGACIPPPSCESSNDTCGTEGESCCTTLLVDAGKFQREDPQGSPAEVSSFLLDKFEISVGRFAKFIESGGGLEQTAPTPGAGKHPSIGPDSGWASVWNTALVADKNSLVPPGGASGGVNCHGYATWNQDDSTKPMNCITWYEAFAFCIWDGGRLPTEAEWAYAAAGGKEQRIYPWGNSRPEADAELAIWNCRFGPSPGICSASSIAPVGSAPGGNGSFGQADLSGNLSEWVFDWYADYKNPCVDCAELSASAERSVRGGDFASGSDPTELTSYRRAVSKPSARKHTLGARCVRDVQP